MSFREAIFVDEIWKSAKVTLHRIMQTKRDTFWGETPIIFRIRKQKAAGRIRREQISVVKPNLHNYKLYSQILGKQIDIKATPHMVRFIEASGGLDDYLLKTPDEKLFSDVASKLKVELLQVKQGLRDRTLLPAAAAAAAASQGAVAQQGQGEQKVPPWASGLDEERQGQLQRLQEQHDKARKERVREMLKAATNAETLSVMQRRQ